MQIVLLIGLGGFFGTIARYLIGNAFTQYSKPNFPFATLTVNLLGCFLIGLIYGWFEKQQLNSSDWKLILTAGFCGGFTTFSAFSMENIQMMRDGQTLMAILYIFSSLLFGLLLTWLGMSLTRT
mgnify:FL=1